MIKIKIKCMTGAAAAAAATGSDLFALPPSCGHAQAAFGADAHSGDFFMPGKYSIISKNIHASVFVFRPDFLSGLSCLSCLSCLTCLSSLLFPGEYIQKTVVGMPVKCITAGRPTPRYHSFMSIRFYSCAFIDFQRSTYRQKLSE